MAKRHSRKVSDATKFKMSIAKQGRKNPMFGNLCLASNIRKKLRKRLARR